MNLLSLLLKLLLSKDSVNSVSNKTGVSSELIRKLLPLAIPLLIKYMTKNASSQNGAMSLLGALAQHTSNRSMPEQIDEVDEEDGKKIIGHILGDDSDEVVERLSKQSGIGKAAVFAILAAIAPAILSGLSAANNSAQQQQQQQQQAALTQQQLQQQIEALQAQQAQLQQQQQAAAAAQNSGLDLSDLMSMFGGASAQQVQPEPQQSGLGLLSSLLGGQQQAQPQQQSSGLGLLGSLLGGGQQQAQPQQQSSLGLLGSLLGGNAASAQQAQTEASFDGSDLLNLLGMFAGK